MAEGLHLVEKTTGPGNQLINNVSAVIINSDDGKTTAQIIADAVALCNSLHLSPDAGDPYPTGYFDTVNLVSDLVTSGDFRTDQDGIIFNTIGVTKT